MIVPMVGMTAVGVREEKTAVFSGLQDLGCLHLIPLRAAEGEEAAGPAAGTREALRYLMDCPQRRSQALDGSPFAAARVESRALEIKRRALELSDERDALLDRIAGLKPWGDFDLPPEGELGGRKLWFYAVPPAQMKKIAGLDLIREEVGQDNRFRYLAVISEDEPKSMPVPRTHAGTRSLSALNRRLDEVETEMDDLEAERSSLTRWCTLFSRGVYALENAAARARAESITLDDGPLFGLAAWAPSSSAEALRAFARERGLVLEIREPAAGETPPTAFSNPALLAGGQDLVSVYLTPDYRLWDPSVVVFFSFSIFFAMIIADAAYALVLALTLGILWRRLGGSAGGRRFRILCVSIVGASLVYGVLSGGYFGVEPAEGSFLARLVVLHPKDFDLMMKVTILLGAAHLALANFISAWRRRNSLAALAPAGWILIFLGGVVLWLGPSLGPASAVRTAGKGSLLLGALFVLLFSGSKGGFGKRLLSGLEGLTRLSAAFGDTLSYMRLFALGLAAVSLAGAFNGLAAQVRGSIPGLGLLIAMIILLFGHTLNLVLGIMGGVIHGLRLNCIEFFNWSLPEEGYPFRAFKKKEASGWNNLSS